MKWQQWDKYDGMVRCGDAELKNIENWLRDFGSDAYKCLHKSEDHIRHAIYGAKKYDENNDLEKVTFYSNMLLTESEFEEIVSNLGSSYVVYAYHR